MSAISDEEALRRLCKAIKEAGGVRAFARKTGYSATYISQVQRGLLPPGSPLLKTVGVHLAQFYEVFD